MIQRVHPNPLRVSSITRWPGAPPVHQRTFYGTPALALPTRPISTSSAKTTRARSRASGSHRGPFVIIREVGKGRGLSPGTIVGGAFLAVIVGGGYYIYTRLMSGIKVIVDAKDSVQVAISKGLKYTARKAQDTSRAIQESVGYSISKASEELPKAFQATSRVVGGAATIATSTIISHWEWVKKGGGTGE